MFDQKEAIADLQRIQDDKLISSKDLSKQIGINYYTLLKLRLHPEGAWAIMTKRKVRDYVEANRKG